jgi:hypothetical protein
MTEHQDENLKDPIDYDDLCGEAAEGGIYVTNFFITISKDGRCFEEFIDLDGEDIEDICRRLSEKYWIEFNQVREIIEMKILELTGHPGGVSPRLENDITEMKIINNSGPPSHNNSSLISKKGGASTSTSKHYNSSKCPSVAYVKKKSIGLSKETS